jgi:hypothetical protein
MAVKAAELQRQQYLVPRSSIKRLKEMSRNEGVSVGELARRAIELFTSRDKGAEAPASPEAEAAMAVLRQAHAELRDGLKTWAQEEEVLSRRERALADGSFAAQVRQETIAWIETNPDHMRAIAKLFSAGAL